MGSIISNLEDLYEDYELLCKKFKVKKISIRNSDWVKDKRKLEFREARSNKLNLTL